MAPVCSNYYGKGLPYLLREQEESSDSSSDEDAAGADPAVGSKRREIMPEREEGDTEDRYKAKRMAFVRQALQHLTPEERIVLLTADPAELKTLYEETCNTLRIRYINVRMMTVMKCRERNLSHLNANTRSVRIVRRK